MQGTRGTSRDGPGSIDASSADLARGRSRELARGRAGRGSAGAVGLRPGAGGAVGVRRDAVSLGGQPARELGCRPKADVDVGFSGLLQDLNGAVMLDLELRKGRFGLISDTVYANLKDDGGTTEDRLEIKATANQLIQSLAGTYRVGTWQLAEFAGVGPLAVAVDPYAGIRYTYLDTELKGR